MTPDLIPGIPNEYSTSIVHLIMKHADVDAIVLFGSRAKGSYREGSDIDLALKGNNLTLHDRDQILLEYPSLNSPWQLDIVIYELIETPALKAHIDRVGKNVVLRP